MFNLVALLPQISDFFVDFLANSPFRFYVMATLLDSLCSKLNSTALIVPFQINPIVLSHCRLLEQVLKFQKKLAAIGISPKEAVAIAFPNTIDFAIAFLATTFQRAISAPLNQAYKQDEFKFFLGDLSEQRKNAELLLQKFTGMEKRLISTL
jgi:acyl-CoA synthetase (AMP-forming)/AMP-acid ligase II